MSGRRLPSAGNRKHWITALGASTAFVLIGIALLPALVTREPTPALKTRRTPDSETAAVASKTSVRTAVDTAERSQSDIDVGPPSSFSVPLLFDCMISASESVAIGSSILGTIETITVERSDFVEAGQVLATLESRVEEVALRVAKARAERTVELESTKVSLKLGKRRRDRAVDLHNRASLSLENREEVETEVALAKLGVEEARENHRLDALQLDLARAALDRRTIRSPIAGFVVERLMSPGEVVDDETILTVSQIDPLRVDVILPKHLFGAVAPGDEMEIRPEAPLDQTYVTTVSIVDRVLDGASGTFGVRLLLENRDHQLPGGLRCQARLLNTEEALVHK